MTSLLNRTRRPDITFYRDGHIDITARISKLLGLQRGDIIDICHEQNEYLLFIRAKKQYVVGRHVAVCYPTKTGNNFRAHSKTLCNAIMQVANCTAETTAVRIAAGEPVTIHGNTTALPLITRNPL